MRIDFQNRRRDSSPSTSGADTGQGARGFFSRSSGGGRSPRKSPCAAPRISEQGSALLIVLGFLSFMMISAVSFAVYMRIERQASSNYRHATAARHLLNAGLYRAIDDIDGELRIPATKINGVNLDRPRKFPVWPGRVKTSAVPNGERNGLDARVLSLEALSFIPGVLVNDVRRFAIPNSADVTPGVGGAKLSYMGAKWRPITRPASVTGGPQSEVGRYAYVCINVSDMLDVNVCKASIRDSMTNRVSIGHLFTDAQRVSFDAYYKNTAKHYDTLQDFYACMYKSGDPTFGSPYHEYLNNGSDAKFADAFNHILVTDSIVKAQPTVAGSCNILATPPISAGVLQSPQPSAPSIVLQADFKAALEQALLGSVPAAQAGGNLMATMIADYIDKDSIPKQLNMPSVEMVPMISQILVSPMFKPYVESKPDPASDPADPTPTRIYFLNFIPLAGPNSAKLEVEVVWPFKNTKDRTSPPSSDYKIDIVAYMKVNKVHAQQKSNSFIEPPTAANGYLKWTGTAPAPDFSTKNDANQEECYKSVSVSLTPQLQNNQKTFMDIINTKGVIKTVGFEVGKQFSVSLIVFARVKYGNTYVDSVPQLLPYPNAGAISDDAEFQALQNKIFFQTFPAQQVQQTMTAGAGSELSYEWASLEVPDPRFNYKASNWLKSTDVNFIPQKGINPPTLALVGKDGRDGDIYMAVSNLGQLQSPGELGFIVRPFLLNVAGTVVDYRTRTAVDPQFDDSDNYFRTIRLYNHGDPTDRIKRGRDHIYDYFTAMNPDGTLMGARVNPFSDIPEVLAAAMEKTPVDYWHAALKPDNTFEKTLGLTDWQKFKDAWTRCLTNSMLTADINKSWKRNIGDIYGGKDPQLPPADPVNKDFYSWYADNDVTTVFKTPPAFSATLSTPLHEIDRKMLYSFSLESFSDRQQLFLYILRAEATIPSFGGAADSNVKSLAGGRAVALVWRDPYPQGYVKPQNPANNDTWTKNDQWYNWDQSVDSGQPLVSPWYQHNIKKYDDNKDDDSGDDTISNPGNGNKRLDGYHEHRILYFKQLDN